MRREKCMFHSLDMSAESRRPVPAPRTRPVSRPEYFTPPVPPRRLTVPIDTPKASVVLEMSLRELVRWCDKLDVSDHGLKTEEQYRHALLQHLIDRSHRRRPTHSVQYVLRVQLCTSVVESALFCSHLLTVV